MARTFNPYRTWANDGEALSQWTNTPSVIWQECKTCHHNYNTDEVKFVGDECEECQAMTEFTEVQQIMIEVLYDEWYAAQWSDLYWGWFNYLVRLEVRS